MTDWTAFLNSAEVARLAELEAEIDRHAANAALVRTWKRQIIDRAKARQRARAKREEEK